MINVLKTELEERIQKEKSERSAIANQVKGPSAGLLTLYKVYALVCIADELADMNFNA